MESGFNLNAFWQMRSLRKMYCHSILKLDTIALFSDGCVNSSGCALKLRDYGFEFKHKFRCIVDTFKVLLLYAVIVLQSLALPSTLNIPSPFSKSKKAFRDTPPAAWSETDVTRDSEGTTG
ncbi:hypothetical protein Tco_1439924 [Tanacetum coccineum]